VLVTLPEFPAGCQQIHQGPVGLVSQLGDRFPGICQPSFGCQFLDTPCGLDQLMEPKDARGALQGMGVATCLGGIFPLKGFVYAIKQHRQLITKVSSD
jgi:hypothetical protein